MHLTRWQRLGLATVVGALLAGGATALVVQAVEGSAESSNTAGTTDAATAAATDDPARATPTDPAGAVAVPVATEPQPAPVATEPEPVPVASGPEPALSGSVTAQMDYVFAHWKLENYNSAEWGVLGINDCVNFASQAMIARGWTMDSVWSSARNGDPYDSSAAWRSSTALMNYIASTGKATARTDQQRDLVKVGDIVQFDWDNSGDRDHTGIVSKVEGSGDDISISYASHTEDADYRTVDFAITERRPGGTAYYWSVP